MTKGILSPAFAGRPSGPSLISAAAIQGFDIDMYQTAPKAKAAMAATMTLTNSMAVPIRCFANHYAESRGS